MDIREILDKIYVLPPDAAEQLIGSLSVRQCRKGVCLLAAGKVEPDVFFISRGVARAYVCSGDRKVTFWIGTEGAVLLSLKSYVNDEPGYETIELLEDSVVYVLKRSELKRLLATDIHVANWARRLAETEFLRTEERLIPFLFTTAAQRYETLLKSNPALLQRIPLETLASYLGITPVSLSRIRARIK